MAYFNWLLTITSFKVEWRLIDLPLSKIQRILCIWLMFDFVYVLLIFRLKIEFWNRYKTFSKVNVIIFYENLIRNRYFVISLNFWWRRQIHFKLESLNYENHLMNYMFQSHPNFFAVLVNALDVVVPMVQEVVLALQSGVLSKLSAMWTLLHNPKNFKMKRKFNWHSSKCK